MYKLKKISDTDLKLKFLETIACGLDKEFIESYSEIYIKFSKAFNYKKKALKRIRYHRELGERCILTSASFDFYVIPMGFELGFSEVIATKSVWSDNKLLPLIDGNNLKGIFKLNEIKKLVGENSVDKTVTVYTDHMSDLPILEYADVSKVINPNNKMKKVIKNKNYRVEKW